MANNSINLAALDFDTLKQNFISYLGAQSAYKDYNFNGSNMNVLLDVLSYNTYLNSFYLNMVASEMFMDSAQKLDSVISHAKELNYLPKSAKSSVADISFTISTVGISSPFTIPKGTSFVGQNSNNTFTFVTKEVYNYISANNTFKVDNLKVFEGTYVTDSFVVDNTVPEQRFVLSNSKIDTDSLTVTVKENGIETVYTSVETLFGLTSTSTVFFLQAAQNGQYEIVFGDGLLGQIPKNLATITANYRITNGADGSGINAFSLVTDLGIVNGGTATISPITVNDSSMGGSAPQTIESIRKQAPRYFATQQRAVSTDDYTTLILDKFGGQISDVSVFGGQELYPKLYGRVVVCIKPSGGTVAPTYLKDAITTYLQPYIALPNRVKIADPDYLYVSVDSEVQCDFTTTTRSAATIEGIVRNAIKGFSTDHIEVFNNDFRYSKFVTHIDQSDPSITSNNTKIKIIKRIAPTLNYATSYILDYGNPTEVEERNPAIGYNYGDRFFDEPVITTTPFTFVDDDGNSIDNCYIRDDNFGFLVVYKTIVGKFTIVKDKIGLIDYTTGIVSLQDFKVSNYTSYISIFMSPKNKDIIASKDKIVIIDPKDVNISVIQTQK
jgi:hypothetical protein